jgi:hypothetical protein
MDDVYYFHQTPKELAKKLIQYIDFSDNDLVLEHLVMQKEAIHLIMNY